MARQQKSLSDPLLEEGQSEPSSGPRRKRASEHVQLLIAELKGRAKGLDGEALDRECERFIERLIDANVRVAPEGMHGDLREILRSRVEEDPTLQAMFADLRASVRRG